MSDRIGFGGFVPCVADLDYSSLRGRRRIRLRVSALSTEEWSYLHGLFLADGNRSSFYYGKTYQGSFFLQGNERELAEKAIGLLERVGLHPKLRVSEKSRMFEVRFYSVALLDLLADGWALAGDASLRERFFDSNEYLTVQGGIPFFAGLLDGDGHCEASLAKSRWAESCVYGVTNLWHWVFAQSKFPFLVDYVKRFLRVVSPRGGLYVYRVPSGFGDGVGYHVCLAKPVICALLGAGIARYSWKVARWIRRVCQLQSLRASCYRLSEVAQLLHVNRKTVWRWVQAGKLRYLRRSQWFYIPASEVQRLRKQLTDMPRRL